MENLQLFAHGFEVITWNILGMIVIGFIALGVKGFKQKKKEKADKIAATQEALKKKIAAFTAALEVQYVPKYETFYMFDAETNKFIAQSTNILDLMQYVSEHYIQYELISKDETTANVIAETARRLRLLQTANA